MSIDNIPINFNPQNLWILNTIIAVMVFGVCLDLKPIDFKRVFLSPKSSIIGLGAQFILLPAFTWCLILLLEPLPSLALGMILVASCPGGNISNFLTHLAKGNSALSISMTSISTIVAIFMTPLNLHFWGTRYGPAAQIIQEIHLSVVDVFLVVATVLLLPLLCGMFVSVRYPQTAEKLAKILKYFSIFFLIVFIIGSFSANASNFREHVGFVLLIVVLHNSTAFTMGYVFAFAGKLSERDRRAVSMEVGNQNCALALILVFNFFPGLSGMALLAALWGVCHLIVGFSLALFWSRGRFS